MRSWRGVWEHVVPFLPLSQPIGRAATKLIYLALRHLKLGWRPPPLFWHQARPDFAIFSRYN